MKRAVCSLFIASVWFLEIAACNANHASYQDSLGTPIWVVTQDVQDEYSKALNRWQSHHLSNYEITVDIFSSVLAPPCSSKATLKVQNNQLFTVSELETPMPIQLPDKSIIYNPECHDYENYLIEKQFELVENRLTGKLSPVSWSVKFDAEYGFSTRLVYMSGGETIRAVSYSNFKPR